MFKSGLILKDRCYVPEHDDFWDDKFNWKCVVYTRKCPEWFRKNQKQYEASFREAVWNCVSNHIKTGEKVRELSEGVYFLIQCKVEKTSGNTCLWLQDSVVMRLQDDVVVKSMSGESSIQCMSGNVLVEKMSGNSWIQHMQDSSKVQSICDSAVVQHMEGASSICGMAGRAIVQNMTGHTTVSSLSGSAVVQTMKDNATVFSMCDNSMIQSMNGEATIRKMKGMTLVQSMYGHSRIQDMGKGSKVAFMRDSSSAVRKDGRMWKAPKSFCIAMQKQS